MPENPELVNIPQDLTLISAEELRTIEQSATAEFTRLSENDDVTPDALESLMTLTDGIERLRAEIAVRDERVKQEAERQRIKLQDDKARLQTRILGQPDVVAPDGTVVASAGGDTANVAAIAEAAARGATAALVAALGDRHIGRDLADVGKRASATLADAARYAPKPKAAKPQLAITAGVDIPGLARGAELNNISALSDAFHRRARGMSVTRGQPNEQLVASIRNEFEHTVDDRTSPRDIDELFRYLTSRDKQDALVAGGGWCAPSEIRYDFFNVACEDGLVDLPSFGVSRGGIRFPISPSLADAFGGVTSTLTSGTNPWLWTETDDIATVTGAPNKPCVRVPCPTFDEKRLECFGICLTAGNLTDDAYPEATANYLRLLMSAHAHAINGRLIAQMVSLSAACVTGGAFASGGPAYNAILGGVSLGAVDYRARYGMCEDDVIEVLVPQWVVGAIQADLARRGGTDSLLSVNKATITSYFADRNIRPQFVNDWQVRGAGQFGAAAGRTAWPTSVNILMYAAGTFIRGNGLTLDLGVVRDSTLNAENDHTAAWTEECNLVARVGHESRCYTISIDVAGDTCCDDLTALVDGAGVL